MVGTFEGLGRIAQVALSVDDVGRAVEYYRDRLGMRLLFESGGMAFFDCAGIRLLVGPRDDPDAAPGAGGGAGAILYFDVPDIGDAHDALSARGVEFVEAPRKVAELEGRDLWLAFLRDPWGNLLGLMSEVARE